MITLRSEVQLTRRGSEIELYDPVTGLRLLVSGAEALLTEGRVDDPGKLAELRALLQSAALLDEGLSPSGIRRRQQTFRNQLHRQDVDVRLQKLLQIASERVPYYRKIISDSDSGHVRSPLELAKLPLLEKATLRANYDDFVAEGIDVPAELAAGDLEFVASSGTTGERLAALSDMTLPRVPAQYQELWGIGEGRRVPKCAVFTSPTCMGAQCHLGLSTYEQRLQHEYTLILNSSADLFDISRQEVTAIAEELERFEPDFFLANPVYLHWLIRAAQSFVIDLPKVAFVLSSYQYLSRVQREAIEAFFGAPVFDFYAATELGGCQIGVECGRGRLHVREDHTLLETVNTPGLETKTEGVRPLAVTTLAARVTPLIRYLVGDVGRFVDEACDCVVGHWPCFELHGRMRDMLLLNGKWVTTRDVDEVVAKTPGVDFYRCYQSSSTNLRFDVISKPNERFLKAELADRVREALGAEDVQVREVRRLEPEPSLKYGLTQSPIPVPEIRP